MGSLCGLILFCFGSNRPTSETLIFYGSVDQFRVTLFVFSFLCSWSLLPWSISYQSICFSLHSLWILFASLCFLHYINCFLYSLIQPNRNLHWRSWNYEWTPPESPISTGKSPVVLYFKAISDESELLSQLIHFVGAIW